MWQRAAGFLQVGEGDADAGCHLGLRLRRNRDSLHSVMVSVIITISERRDYSSSLCIVFAGCCRNQPRAFIHTCTGCVHEAAIMGCSRIDEMHRQSIRYGACCNGTCRQPGLMVVRITDHLQQG
jgi:hypothetical protein